MVLCAPEDYLKCIGIVYFVCHNNPTGITGKIEKTESASLTS